MTPEQIQQTIEDTEERIEKSLRNTISEVQMTVDEITENIQLSSPLSPGNKKVIENELVYPITTRLAGSSAATAANYGIFLVADNPYEVIGISEVHETAGTDGSAVTLQIERLQGTEAPTNGDTLLRTAFDLKGTANTVQYGELVAGEARILNRGDRLALKDSGTLTSVAGVCVTVFLRQR